MTISPTGAAAQAAGVGVAVEERLVLRDHPGDLGLLEHQLGHEHRPRVPGAAPGQVAPGGVAPRRAGDAAAAAGITTRCTTRPSVSWGNTKRSRPASLGVGADQLAHLVEQRLARLGVERGDEAGRGGTRPRRRRAVAICGLGNERVPDVAEQPAGADHLDVVGGHGLARAELVVRRVGPPAAAGHDELGELPHPVHRLVAHVPDRGPGAARAQHPVDLGQGAGRCRTSGTPGRR